MVHFFRKVSSTCWKNMVWAAGHSIAAITEHERRGCSLRSLNVYRAHGIGIHHAYVQMKSYSVTTQYAEPPRWSGATADGESWDKCGAWTKVMSLPCTQNDTGAPVLLCTLSGKHTHTHTHILVPIHTPTRHIGLGPTSTASGRGAPETGQWVEDDCCVGAIEDRERMPHNLNTNFTKPRPKFSKENVLL